MAIGRNGITGTARVLRNFNREVRAIKMRGAAGMVKAALIVKRRSMQLTPVDTGNLKGSAYTAISASLIKNPVAEIGYTASYALYVHEMDKVHKPPTQWKFLETALKEKEREALEAIKSDAHIRSTGRIR